MYCVRCGHYEGPRTTACGSCGGPLHPAEPPLRCDACQAVTDSDALRVLSCEEVRAAAKERTSGIGKWSQAQFQDVAWRRSDPWTVCRTCDETLRPSAEGVPKDDAKAARALCWIVLGAALLWAAFAKLGVTRLELDDPARAAKRLSGCKDVWSQSGTIYGSDPDKVLITTPLVPELVRQLRLFRVRVDARPDHPGWIPLGGMVLLSVLFAFAASRRVAAALIVLTVGITTIYLAQWGHGAQIDESEDGIYRRSYEQMPSHLKHNFFANSSADGQKVMAALQERYVLIERARTGESVAFWVFNCFLRWGMGLALIGLTIRQLTRCLGPQGSDPAPWLALIFPVALVSVLPFLLAAERVDPAYSYWTLYLVCVAGCWVIVLRKLSPPRAPARRTAAARVLAFVAAPLLLVGQASAAQDPRGPFGSSGDQIAWGSAILRPGDVIVFGVALTGGAEHVGMYLGKDECGQPTFFDFYPGKMFRRKGNDYWGRVVPETTFVKDAAEHKYAEFRVLRLKDTSIDKGVLVEEAKRTAGKQFLGVSFDGLSVCTTTVSRVLSKASGKDISILMPGSFDSSSNLFDPVTSRRISMREALTYADLRRKEWDKTAVEQCRTSAEVPPQSPGGIALGTKLEKPSELDRVRRVSLGADGIRLETGDSYYLVDSLDASDFALILRCLLLNGEAPALSIGSEPSTEFGSARVTYFGGIRGTSVGHDMLAADLKLKAILLGMAAGPRGTRLPGTDDLFRGFPGAGGDFVRLWIVGSSTKIRVEGRRVVLADAGLKLMDETMLRGAPIEDSQLRAFTKLVSESFPVLKQELPEFKALENLVLMSALAFWIRSSRIDVDPDLLALPANTMETPLHVPLSAASTPEGMLFVSGGVTLTPEAAFGGPGRRVIHKVHAFVSEMPAWKHGAFMIGLALLLAALLLGPPALFHRALRRSASQAIPPFRRVLLLWLLTQGAVFAALTLAAPAIAGSRLAASDREWIQLVGVFVVPLLVFRIAAPRLLGAGPWEFIRKGSLHGAAILTSASAPAAVLLAGLTLAVLTALLVPRSKTDEVEANAVTIAITPLESALALLVAYDPTGDELRLGYQSLLAAQRHLFRSTPVHRPVQSFVESDPRDLDPLYPWVRMKRIQWSDPSAQRQGYVHYSVTGDPPY